jgi:hypothetical protein
MENTSKTQLQFEPGAAQFDIATGGEQYDTPEWFQDRLGDLAQLTYLPAEWAVQLDASQANTGVVTVELMAGTSVLASKEVDFSAGVHQGERMDVDLFNVGGAQRLHVRCTVDTPGTGTAEVRSWLSISQPLVVGGC